MKNEEWKFVSNQAEELDISWFNLHITPKFYLFTQSKIASSWSVDRFGKHYHFPINVQTLECTKQSQDEWIKSIEIEDEAEKKKAAQFYRDWNNIISGKSSKKDFIFLIRNPIDKKIAGFIQDVLLYNLNERSFTSPFLIKHWMECGFTRFEINEYRSNCAGAQTKTDNVHSFPNTAGKNNKFLPLLREAVKPVVDNWFNNTVNFINEVNDDHKHTNYFLLHKLFASRNNKIDKSKIRLIDIDRQNLGLTFQQQFGMKVDESKLHERNPVLKTCVYEAFMPHMNQLMSQIKHECLIYCDLINYVYPQEMYETKTNPSYVYTEDEFIERYNLKPMHKYDVAEGIEVMSLMKWFAERAGRFLNQLKETDEDEDASTKANKALLG